MPFAVEEHLCPRHSGDCDGVDAIKLALGSTFDVLDSATVTMPPRCRIDLGDLVRAALGRRRQRHEAAGKLATLVDQCRPEARASDIDGENAHRASPGARNASTSAAVGIELPAPTRWTDRAAAAFARTRADRRSLPPARPAASVPTKQSPAPVVSVTSTAWPAISIGSSHAAMAMRPRAPRVTITVWPGWPRMTRIAAII